MTTVVPDRKGIRRMRRFENAVGEKAFEGSIPWDSEEAIAMHEAINDEYDRAEKMLIDHMNEQALRIVDLEERIKVLDADVAYWRKRSRDGVT